MFLNGRVCMGGVKCLELYLTVGDMIKNKKQVVMIQTERQSFNFEWHSSILGFSRLVLLNAHF